MARSRSRRTDRDTTHCRHRLGHSALMPDPSPGGGWRFARALQAEARTHDFDSLTGVAIIHFETHWTPNLVSADGEDFGLGQVRARFMGACRNDADPVGSPSDGCRAVKAALLGGEYNIHRMAVIISANRELCRAKTGTAYFPQWLAGYEGLRTDELKAGAGPTRGRGRSSSTSENSPVFSGQRKLKRRRCRGP